MRKDIFWPFLPLPHYKKSPILYPTTKCQNNPLNVNIADYYPRANPLGSFLASKQTLSSLYQHQRIWSFVWQQGSLENLAEFLAAIVILACSPFKFIFPNISIKRTSVLLKNCHKTQGQKAAVYWHPKCRVNLFILSFFYNNNLTK